MMNIIIYKLIIIFIICIYVYIKYIYSTSKIIIINDTILPIAVYIPQNETYNKKDVNIYFNVPYKEGIPKLIHHSAPKETEKWASSWQSCYESWLLHFPIPEYTHVMWYDEDLDNIIDNIYPWFKDMYKSYPKNIMRYDISRCFILYTYGGIYADMDYKCNKNFYDILPQNKVSISESPYKHNENLQNALMCSPQGHIFWIYAIINSIKAKEYYHIFDVTGPRLIDKTHNMNLSSVNILPYNLYNPSIDSEEFNDDNKVITKHLLSSVWANKNVQNEN